MRFKARILSAWDAVRSSYWFVPSLMALAAFLLSWVTLWIDRRIAPEAPSLAGWFYTGTAEGARSMLSVIAGSMIGTAGVVFSITIVALQLASSQFGPRLLRTFMRDLSNQVVLGTFIASFLYCLMILRNVHAGVADHSLFIPQVSLLAALALAVAGLIVLIYFVHHTAAMIQAPNVIDAVARELRAAIDTLYPEPEADPPPAREEGGLPDDFETASATLTARDHGRAGYIQRIEIDQLSTIAADRGLTVRLEKYPGQFILPDERLMLVHGRGRTLDDDASAALRSAYTIGPQRTLAQDAGFALDQLVEVAVRALSPGINDPFTAAQCTDRIGEALSYLAGRTFPSRWSRDSRGIIRVEAVIRPLDDFIDTSLGPIIHAAERSLVVLLRVLESAARIAARLKPPLAKQVLLAHSARAHQLALELAATPSERQRVRDAWDSVQHAASLTDAPLSSS